MNGRTRRLGVTFGLIGMPPLTAAFGIVAYSKIDENSMEAGFYAVLAILGLILTVRHYHAFIKYVQNYIKLNGIKSVWEIFHACGITTVVVAGLCMALFLFMRIIAGSDDPYIPIINRLLGGSVIGALVGAVIILLTRKKI
jgi:hypothetical protein